jgi:PEP-CTERM motif
MIMSFARTSGRGTGLVFAIGLLMSQSTVAVAEIISVVVAKSAQYRQVSDGVTGLNPGQSTFSATAYEGSAGQYSSMTLATPGPAGTITLGGNGSPFTSTSTFANPTSLDAAYTTGTYTFTGSGGTAGTTMSSLMIAANDYPGPAYLTGTNYSDLQNLDPTESFTFHWNSLVAQSGVDSSEITFIIFNNTTHTLVADENLNSSATSAMFAAGTFVAGDSYGYTIIFDNFLEPSLTQTVNFENLTAGFFRVSPSAIVPEPGSLTLSTLGGLAVVAWKRRRSLMTVE